MRLPARIGSFMKKKHWSLLLLLFTSTISAQSLEQNNHPFLKLETKSHDEALFLRRIIEFWDEKSYELVESQILTFVEKFPKSELNDPLFALLGDLYAYRKDLGRALQAYSRIVSPQVQEQVLLSQLQCLHSTKRYEEITKVASPFMDKHLQSKKDQSLEIVSLVADSNYHLASHTGEFEKAQGFAKEAQKHYERLLTTDRASECLEPLAYLHHMMNENERAADLYMMAARSNPASEEKLLFKAATLQAKFDKEAALETFSRVARMNKKQCSDAAFNRMVLLFDTKKFDDLVLAKDQLYRQIPKDSRDLYHFFLGRSYFEMQDPKRAVTELVMFVEEKDAITPERKAAILTLIECSRIQKDFPQFDQYLALLEKEYPKAEEIPEAIFVRAMLNREQHYLEDARRDLERLVQDFPDYSRPMIVQYEYAKILFDVEDFAMSRQKFKDLIETHPEHSMNALAWHYFIQSSISLSNFERSDQSFVKDQLAFDLELFLSQEGLLTPQEKLEYELLLGRTNYEIQAYEEAIELLHEFVKKDLRKDLEAEGYLVLAYCYRKGMNDLNRFCEFAEKSIAISELKKNPSEIHLGLFNAYLQRSKSEADQKDYFVSQAADHLYRAQKKGADIKQKNKIWLADFYYLKAKESPDGVKDSDTVVYMKRSIEVFERAFQTTSLQLIILDDSTVNYVPYILKLAALYEMRGDFQKKREILAQLHSQYSLNPQLKWVHVDEIFYELAKEYSKLPEKKREALSLYESIMERSPSLQKFVSASSCLSSARLRYQELKEKGDRTDPELQTVLAQLKNLTIQRDVNNEPIHLEAALEYVAVHTFTEPEEEKFTKRVELLTRLQENFQQTEDILGKDYHAKREQIPEKNHLFQLYMTFFEAEILYYKSQLANKESRLEDEKYYGEQANRLYLQLKEEHGITDYLLSRIAYRLKNSQGLLSGQIF